MNRRMLWLYGRFWTRWASGTRYFALRSLAEMGRPGLRIVGGVMWQPGKPKLRFWP